jgi:hypothetical protein
MIVEKLDDALQGLFKAYLEPVHIQLSAEDYYNLKRELEEMMRMGQCFGVAKYRGIPVYVQYETKTSTITALFHDNNGRIVQLNLNEAKDYGSENK